MARPEPYHAAYILRLIRAGTATTWSMLCAHFEVDPGPTLTQHAMLFESLKALAAAGLIQPEGELNSLRDISADAAFSVTPLLGQLQSTLKFSLSDLARSDPSQRLMVQPVLRRTFACRYAAGIFVVMPFSQELAPVYEDHLARVAQTVGLSMSRADDFFSTGNIMDEIWTALVDAKVVVADCTGKNPNVFYEIGLAHAIGKPTILITQEDEYVPFDLQHRRYLKYEFTPRGMRIFEEQLSAAISLVLAEESIPA